MVHAGRRAVPWEGSGAARVSPFLISAVNILLHNLLCLILGQLGVTISHASLGRALLRVFRCLQSCKQCSRASEAAISETPRWAGGRSLKQNCQSKELVPLATVMLEIGLREGAKKHAQKSSYQLFAVKLEEGPGRGGHPARLRSPLPCTGGRPKTAGSE